MFVVVRPGILKLVALQERRGDMGKGVLAIVFVGMLLSALATELIGIHAIFGAFLLGALIPHDTRVARDLGNKLDDVVVVLLLPAFFAYTGMRTQIGLVNGADRVGAVRAHHRGRLHGQVRRQLDRRPSERPRAGAIRPRSGS